MTASVLNRAELAKGLAAIVDAFVSRVMADRELSRTAKEDLLKDLSSWPLVLEQVPGSQTRLRRNGKHPDDDAVKQVELCKRENDPTMFWIMPSTHSSNSGSYDVLHEPLRRVAL